MTVFWQISDRFLTHLWNWRDLHSYWVPKLLLLKYYAKSHSLPGTNPKMIFSTRTTLEAHGRPPQPPQPRPCPPRVLNDLTASKMIALTVHSVICLRYWSGKSGAAELHRKQLVNKPRKILELNIDWIPARYEEKWLAIILMTLFIL